MRNEAIITFILLLASISGMGYSAALNVTSNKVELLSYVNTESNVTMLNLTLSRNETSNETIRITNIIINFNSTNENLNASITNLVVCIYNSTINESQKLGCSSRWNVSSDVNRTNITISNFTISNNENKTILIVYEINRSVITPINVSLFLTNDSLITNATNITISFLNGKDYNSTSRYFSSNFTQIQDLHANAKLLPRYVDTNVKEQEIVYIVNSSGKDDIKSIILEVPSNFSIVSNNIKFVITKSDNTTATFSSCTDLCKLEENKINLTSQAGIKLSIINISLNTTEDEGDFTFNSKIYGENLSDVSTDVNGSETKLFVKQLFNITNVGVMKNIAIVNGSDYWLFNFTIIMNANVSGLIQFKMNDWKSDSKNATIPITNGTGDNATYYASMWLSGNESNIFNVTNEYNINRGVRLNAIENRNYTLILKMIIPRGIPIASDWWTTYSMLFRSIP
ncbi:MAG: hypothetical protein KQA36_00960 [Candidatus Aenigmarchaeota archaeon]|nr:hypothetical protein [Candidatus Aenigmarchaeota archaeon]